MINTGPRFVQADGYPYGFPAQDWRPDLAGILQTWESGDGAEVHIAAARHDPWWRDCYARCRRAQLAPTGTIVTELHPPHNSGMRVQVQGRLAVDELANVI